MIFRIFHFYFHEILMVLYPSGHFTAPSWPSAMEVKSDCKWHNRMEHDKAKYSEISPSSDHKMAKLGKLRSNLTTKGGKPTRWAITTADVTHSWLLFWLCCLKTVGNKCFKHNTPSQLNFSKNPAHILSEPEQNKQKKPLSSVVSRQMSEQQPELWLQWY